MRLFQSVMHDLHADVLFKTTKVNTLLQRHGNGFIDSYRKASFENVLVSYFYLGIKQNIKNHSLLKEKFFFLDSGAYSAMSTGTPVDVYQYIDWIKENRAMIDLYCGLDDIGDYKKTLENQRIMEAAGLHPLITFHYGEPFELLRDFCQEYEFICLGGIAGKRKQQRTPWLDNCFSVIKDYWPKRLHVFGVHDKDILLRYPFYSADASTDSLSAAMGNTAVGRMDDGKGVTLNKFQVMKGQANSTLTLSEKSQLRFATLAIKKEAIEKSITSIWAARGIKWE